MSTINVGKTTFFSIKMSLYLIVAGVFLAPGMHALAQTTAIQKGDVFAAVGGGKVHHFRPDGVLVRTLDTGMGGRNTTGMAFDAEGNLFITHFSGDRVFKAAADGATIEPFGSGFDSHPESIVLDEAGKVYIGHADGDRRVLSFSASGELLAAFSPEIEARGTDWIDLAADQKTLFYTSEGRYVKRYDLETHTQLPDFNTEPLSGSEAYALRILRGGGVIVADAQVIVRLDAAGTIVQTYDAPGEDDWFAVNLDPDGKTFWSGNLSTGRVYRFEIDSGVQVAAWDSQPVAELGGLAVYGEITDALPFTWPRMSRWMLWPILGLPLLMLALAAWQRLRRPRRRRTLAPPRPPAPLPPRSLEPPPSSPRPGGETIRPD